MSFADRMARRSDDAFEQKYGHRPNGTPGHIEIISETTILPEGMPLDDNERHHFAVYVKNMGPSKQFPLGAWAVTTLFDQLSRAGKWGNPQGFQKHQYRWETREEALDMAHKHVDQVEIHGHTWADWKKKKFKEDS